MKQEAMEAKKDLLDFLGLEATDEYPALDVLVEGGSKYIRDLKYNAKTALKGQALTEKEALLLAVSVCANEKNKVLGDALAAQAKAAGATDEEIAEMYSVASLLTINNVMYRFRHFMGDEQYDAMPMRLKMQIMMSPVTGKEFFELASLVVSAVNGCEMCVQSHEKSVRELGASQARVFDAVRIGGVVRGLSALVY